MTVSGDVVEAYLEANHDRRLASFIDFLRIPSVSAEPAYAADCQRAADWLADHLRSIGLDHVEASVTGGHPIVYGDWLGAAGAPTVVVYGHYDVQPADPLDEWTSPPFEPAVVGSRILARGSSDDKSNIAIFAAAVEALLATRGRLPVNLRFVFEGEEESSSAHLAPWLEANRHRLGGDVAIVSDVGFFEGNVPALTIGLRGLMYAQIDVVGPFQDVHSGVYGGAIANPANALAGIIAALKGPDGRIRIPGFYDEVVPLTEADRAAYAALPFDDDHFRDMLRLPELVGEAGYSTLERKAGRPSLDVNGLSSGYQGDGTKTIIPGRAMAKVSSRLVPDQVPEQIFERLQTFVAEIAPPGVEVTTTYLGGGLPVRTSIDHPAVQAAARALEATFGQAPVFIREGGSIPFVATFEEVLGLPVVLMGFTPPDGNFHAPNEWMDLTNFETGIRTVVRYFDELAVLAP
ncbi:MAG TPA: dipeptidase [Patescibacteria group bacterium]|nr:dipeptidase [Patescibacteria group bacterium]